jgi:Ran-binding protein 3
MADSAKQQESVESTGSAVEVQDATKAAPTSPTRSDKSSDSEGKPVRDKLKETRIDAQGTSNTATTSDQHMEEAPNGSAKVGENSASGSDSDRGRLRRKRSREDFEDYNETDKQPEKKQEKEKERHHVRKRSRDVKDIESGLPLKPPAATVTRIEENDGDEQMTTPVKATSKAPPAATTGTDSDTSPKNKRTRDQAEEDTAGTAESAKEATVNGKSGSKSDEERDTKRLRDKEEDVKPAVNPTSKVSSDEGLFWISLNGVSRYHQAAASRIPQLHLHLPPCPPSLKQLRHLIGLSYFHKLQTKSSKRPASEA